MNRAATPTATVGDTLAPTPTRRAEPTATRDIAPAADSPQGARHISQADTTVASSPAAARPTMTPTRDDAAATRPVDRTSGHATTPQSGRQASASHPTRSRPATWPELAPMPVATAPAATTGSRELQPAAPPATDVAPPAPAGGIASASPGAGFAAGAALAILVFLLLVPCLRYGRVRLTPAHWRPVVFVSLLERPG